MQITLNNIEYAPDEPFYSYILENYGEDGYFDPIEVCEKSTDDINQIFRWISRLDWEITNIDTIGAVKLSKHISEYINKNFANCKDLKLLNLILTTNLDTQTDDNLKHYIKLYENELLFTDIQNPFEIWIDLMKLKTEYWSEYFYNKTDEYYNKSSLVELIYSLKNKELKNKWFQKFISIKPKSTDFVKLLIFDDTYNNFEWHKYFKSLNPTASQICSLILKKSIKKYAFTNNVDMNDIYWFDYFQSKKGSGIELIIYQMFNNLKYSTNHNYNLEHWKQFLFYNQPNIESIDNVVYKSNNENLKEKWIFIKKELFNIETVINQKKEFAEALGIEYFNEECPF